LASELKKRFEFTGQLGEISQDHAGLREPLALVQEHRRFAHFVHGSAPFRRARFAVEEVDRDRLPVRTHQVQHEGCFVGIPGLGEAIKFVLGHCYLVGVETELHSLSPTARRGERKSAFLISSSEY
jgi:hypothetical protein